MFLKLFGKRSSVSIESDRIWKTTDLKLDGIAAAITAAGPDERFLLIAHFRDTFLALESLLQSKSIPFRSVTSSGDAADLLARGRYQAGTPILTLSDLLPKERRGPSWYEDFTLSIIVAEHYPIPSMDERITIFARSLACKSRIVFCESLDGAFLQHFASDQIAALLNLLKKPDQAALAHVMVDRSIRAAQKKIAKKVPSDRKASSQEQWFQYNKRR